MAAVILSSEIRATRMGQKFASLTLSDHFGVFEVPFFAEQFERVRNMIGAGQVVYLEVVVRANDDGVVRLIGQRLEKLEGKEQGRCITLAVTERMDLKGLKRVLDEMQSEPMEDLAPRMLCLELAVDGVVVMITLPGKYQISAERKAQLVSIAMG
jgi:DNA polymerase III alpha subunit